MELKIYDKQGNVKMTVSPDNSSQWNHEVGVENVVTVNFTTWEFLVLEVGCYIWVEDHRFSIKSEYRPKHIHNSKYTYNLKFYGREHDTQDILFCRLNQGEDDLESVFAYDGTPMDYLNKVVANMNRNSDGIVWKAGEAITANRQTINFNGLYCWDALGEIARTFGTEWWMDGEYLNLSKCIRGETVRLGYGEGLKAGLSQNENTNAVKWFTRLIPVGSTKNIDKNKYGYANLQLPGREKYIDINTQYGLKEYREEAAFSDIYPHREGTISNVREETRINEDTGTYYVYFVRDAAIPFNPNDYMLAGEVIHLTFNTGVLAGKEFEVNWNNTSKEFEIINQYPDEKTQLPGGNLIPSNGDTYVLSNISMPDEYNTAAEQEFQEAVDAYLEEYSRDISIYSGSTDYVYIEQNNVPLQLGQRIRLVSDQYFSVGARDSRITRVSRKLNNLGEATIDCSDAVTLSWIGKLQSSINNVSIKQNSIQNQTNKIEKEVSNLSSISEYWKLKKDKNDKPYLFSYLPVVTQYGVTMYADNGSLDIPSIYAGLPIDNNTIVRDTNGVLMINPNLDLGSGGGASSWDELEGIPSWIGATKPTYEYSEIKNTPDLSKYVSSDELKKYVTLDGNETITGLKDFTKGIKIDGLPITKLQDDVLYIDSNVVIRGGLTMYYDNGEINLPSIKDEIGNAGYDGATGLASFDSSQFVIGTDGTVSIISGSGGLNTEELKSYLDTNKYTTETWVKEQGYASASSLSSLQDKVNDFLEGSDTDTIINKWKELETFLSGLSESDNLANILTGKVDKSYVDTNFVTIAGTEDVTGVHNFVNGLMIGGVEVIKKSDNLFIKGNLIVEGGVTMYGDGEGGSSIPVYSSLGSLLNVDDSIDASASVDRVLFQAAGSSEWVTKPLSEIGGSVSGEYLPLSGGTINGIVSIQYTTDKYARIEFVNMRAISGVEGSAVSCLTFRDGNSVARGYLGTRYIEDTLLYLYLGHNTYNGNNLRIYSDRLTFGENELAYLTSNVASATKLKTARTFWGQSFDGSGNVDGKITIGATDASSSRIDFTRDGYSYITGKTLSFGPSSDTIDRMLLITSGSATFQCDILPYTNNTYSIGAYGNYFKRIHANSITSGTNVNNLWLSGGASSDDTGVVIARSSDGSIGTEICRFNERGIVLTNNRHIEFKATDGSPYNGMYMSSNNNLIIGYGIAGINKNTYIDGENIIFRQGDSHAEKMRLTSTGLGLGTNSPSYILHAIGTGYFSNGINYSTAASSFNSVGIKFATNLARISVSSSGNMGIYATGIVSIRGNSQSGTSETGLTIDKNGWASLTGRLTLAGTEATTAVLEFSRNGYNYILFPNTLSIGTSTEAASRLLVLNSTNATFQCNILATGGITMYSDQRKKTILNYVELSLKQIADAPLVEHYYSSDQNKTTHVGSIAQYWAGLNDWFCKLDAEGFYTMEIQNAALASAISIARHLEKYETKTDKKIRQLKKRISQLEDELELLKKVA